MASIYANHGRLYVALKVAGKWKGIALGLPVGQEKKAAEAARILEAQLAAGEELGTAPGEEPTLRQWARGWLKQKTRGAADAKSHLEHHILPALGDVKLGDLRAKQIRAFVRGLQKKQAQPRGKDATPRELAPRTVRSIYGTLHSCLRAAAADELIPANPCNLLPDDLPGKVDADPEWRAGAVFTRGEVESLISDERVPPDRRTLYALLFLAGLRFGEAAALRWRNYDPAIEPLGRLLVATSFRTPGRKTKSTKTGVTRAVPVHPTLAKVLATWKAGGWAAMLERADGPGPDDLLLPSREGVERSVNHGLKRFHQDCVRLGLRPRRQHDARRTFVSICRDDGARPDVLRVVTHGPRGSGDQVFDGYTTFDYRTLCEAVSCLRIELKTGTVIRLAEASGGARLSTGRSTGKENPRKP